MSIRDHVLPTPDELRWREIPWRPSFGDAVVEAGKTDRPILLWAMDGHPLGSTCGNGVASRRSLWPDPVVRALARGFVPAADDARVLQRGTSRASDLFREVAEQGHYGGRTQPTNTRQGIYATTARGRLLGSTNTTDAGAAREMIAGALERWHALPAQERLPPPGCNGADAPVERADAADALVLEVYSRDLPRERAPLAALPTDAWNQDHAWFSREEAGRCVPDGPVGTRGAMPAALALRIARFHLVDNVRGQTVAFDAAAIEEARLWSEVVAIAEGAVTLRLEGDMRACQRGVWPVRGYEDRNRPGRQERGYQMRLLGRAVFDLARGRFGQFELVAAGDRWGGTQYNWRGDDLARAPMGVVFVLDGHGPRVPPALDYEDLDLERHAQPR